MTHALEVEMLDLGDADCILVSQWTQNGGYCVLVDGGSGTDADRVRDFLRQKGISILHAVVCTHPHNDHAKGLVKLLGDDSLRIGSGWMHDIRKHLNPVTLAREMAGSSQQAESIRQVVENTEDLAQAFARRGIIPQEPFAGKIISSLPSVTVLGPDEQFYRQTLEEFTKVEVPVPQLSSLSLAASLFAAKPSTSGYGLPAPIPGIRGFGLPFPPVRPEPIFQQLFPPPQPSPDLSALLAGALSNSSVKENPTTQPFNNTSVILGGVFAGHRLLFTGDAGAEALDRIPSDWRNLSWLQVPHHGSDGNLSQTNIERFCPKFAYISAKGDTNHPSRAIVNGLIKVGAQVASTHKNGRMWFGVGFGAPPPVYGPLVLFKGTAVRAA